MSGYNHHDRGDVTVSKTMRGFLSDLYESGSIHQSATTSRNSTNNASSSTTPRRANASSSRRTTAANTTASTSSTYHPVKSQSRHMSGGVIDKVRRVPHQHQPTTDVDSVVFVTGGGASRSGSTISAISVSMDDNEDDAYEYRYGGGGRIVDPHLHADEEEDDTPLAHMAASPFSSAAYSHFKRNGPSVSTKQQQPATSTARGQSSGLKTSVRSPVRQRNEKPLYDPNTAKSRAFNHSISSVAQEENTVTAHRKLQHADDLVSGVLHKHHHQSGGGGGSRARSPSMGAGGGGTSKGAIILHLRSRVEELEALLDNSERANFELGDGCDQLKTELAATRRRHQETLEDIHYHHSNVTKQLEADKEDCIQRCEERVTDLCSEWTTMLNEQAQHDIMSTETQVRAALESSFSLLLFSSSTSSSPPDASLLQQYDIMMRQFSSSMDDRISTSNTQKKELSLQVDAALQLVEDAKAARDVKSQDNRRLTDDIDAFTIELQQLHDENISLKQELSAVQLSSAVSGEEWSELLGRHEVESEQVLYWKTLEMDAAASMYDLDKRNQGHYCDDDGGVTLQLPIHTNPEYYTDQQAFLSAADFIVSRTASRLSSIGVVHGGEDGSGFGGDAKASRTASNAMMGVSCSTAAGRTTSYHHHNAIHVVVPSLQIQLLEMEARGALILSAYDGLWEVVCSSSHYNNNTTTTSAFREPSMKVVRSRATTLTSNSNNNSGGQFGAVGGDGEDDAMGGGGDGYYHRSESTWQNHARPDPDEVLRRLSVGGISPTVSRTPSNRHNNNNAPIPRPYSAVAASSSSRRHSAVLDTFIPSSSELQQQRTSSTTINDGEHEDADDRDVFATKIASLEEELQVVNTTLKNTQDESQQQLTKLSELQAELTSTKELSSELQRRLYMSGEMKKSQQEVMLRNVTEEAVALRREREGWRALVAQLQLDAVEMEDTLRIVESSLFNGDGGRTSSPSRKPSGHTASSSATVITSGRKHRRNPPVPRQKKFATTTTSTLASKPPWVDVDGESSKADNAEPSDESETTTPKNPSPTDIATTTTTTTKPSSSRRVTLPAVVADESSSECSRTAVSDDDYDDEDTDASTTNTTLRHKGPFSYSREHVEWLLLHQQRRLMHSVLTPAIESDTKAHLAAVVDLSLLRATTKDGVGVVPLSSATHARGGTRVGGDSTTTDYDSEITKPPVQTPSFTNNKDNSNTKVFDHNAESMDDVGATAAESLRRFKSRLQGVAGTPSASNNTDKTSGSLFTSLADEIGKGFNLLDAGILFVKHRRFISEVLITAERLEGVVKELSQVRLMLLSSSSSSGGGGGGGAYHHHSSIPTYLKVFLENMSRQLLMLYRDGLMGIVSRDGVDVTGPIHDVSGAVRRVPVLSAWADTEAQDRNNQLTLLRQMDEAALTRGVGGNHNNTSPPRHRSPLRQLKGVPLGNGNGGGERSSYAGGGWVAHNATYENLPPPYTFQNNNINNNSNNPNHIVNRSTASQVQYWPSEPSMYAHTTTTSPPNKVRPGQSGMNSSASFMAEVQHAAHSKHRHGITKNLQFSQKEFDDGHHHGYENDENHNNQSSSSWVTPPRGNRHGQPTSPPSGGMRHEGGGGYTHTQLQQLRQRVSPTKSTTSAVPTSYTRSCTADPVYCFESGHNCREPYYTTLASSAGRSRHGADGDGSRRPSIDVSSPQSPMRSYSSPPAARRTTTTPTPTSTSTRTRGSSSTIHNNNRNKYCAAQGSTFDSYYHVNDRSPIPIDTDPSRSSTVSPTSVMWGKGRGVPTRNNNTTQHYPPLATDAVVVPSLPHGGSWISQRDGGKQQHHVSTVSSTPASGVSIASPERANLLSSSRPFGSSKHGALWESASKAPPTLSRMTNLPPTTASTSE